MEVPILNLKKEAKNLEGEIIPQIKEWFLSGNYIGGEPVKEFEENIKKYLNVDYAITTGNGTDALIISLKACGIKQGDEVITTPFSFFATSEAICSVGANPIFVDINENGFVIDSSKIEEKITKKTKAIMPVHIFGYPCNLDKIYEIAEKYNLAVIEDCCQAIGAKYKNQKIGTGTKKINKSLCCFSFFPTKNLGACGDAGLITTQNKHLSVIIKALKEHGGGLIGKEAKNILDNKNYENEDNDLNINPLYNPYKYYNYLIGCNSRMDSIQAIILNTKLKYLDDYNNKRRHNVEEYTNEFKKINELILPYSGNDLEPCWHQFAIRTSKKEELNKYLNDNNIANAEFYPVPLHLQDALLYLGHKKGDFPIAEKICSETICLPIFPEMDDEERKYVIEKIKEFFLKRDDKK
jgi:dTDP-4-amino-4,6-dideoxygalactose transaminase